MNELEVIDLKHQYQDGSRKQEVLKGVNAKFQSGKFYVIVGESGSGKTTLLSLMSGLDNYQTGEIKYNGKSLKEIGLEQFRLKYSNVVFQSYNLITYMTARENIEIAINIGKIKNENNKEYVYKLLEDVGINREKADRNVLKLSGGEQQRVAIARAISQDVPIIFGDEPTGNLDEETEEKIIDLFKNLAQSGKMVVVVSHSKNIAKKADLVYKITNGIMV